MNKTGPQKKVDRPPAGEPATTNSLNTTVKHHPNGCSEFTRLLGLQRHEPMDAETRAEIDLLVTAAEMGFRLATRCTRCNQWLVAPSSVRRHMGATCAAKAVV